MWVWVGEFDQEEKLCHPLKKKKILLWVETGQTVIKHKKNKYDHGRLNAAMCEASPFAG